MKKLRLLSMMIALILGASIFAGCVEAQMKTKGEDTLANVNAAHTILPPAEQEEETPFAFYSQSDGTLGVMLGENVQLEEVEIPAFHNEKRVTKILDEAFANNATLTRIHIPNTITEIGSRAFLNCTSLSAVYLPESLENLAENAFEGCAATVERNRMEVSYQTESFVLAGESIRLNAVAFVDGKVIADLTWTSANEETATVQGGVVTGRSEGYTTIRAAVPNDPSYSFDFGVTVFQEDTEEILKSIIQANNSNVKRVENLGIGAGTPVYHVDAIESVSRYLYNYDYSVNTQYESIQAGVSSNHGGALGKVEFITVHYTGNMSATAGANFHANYFALGAGGTSAHYVTGNDGVYHILSNSLVAYHAGDGAAESCSAAWTATGVQYEEGDPQYPVWGISSNSKYTINGKETVIPVPTGTTAATQKVTDDRWINKMGFAYKIVNGEYYMNKTWWCYAQVGEGRLCNKGGNLNSIAIESCVNKNSDLWLTWHLTARLVANLMLEYHLPIDRVVGHHFYTAKDCPQPFLANDMELWWDFIACVQAEYDLLTLGEGYDIRMQAEGEYDFLTPTGRITSLPSRTQLITYTVTLTNERGESKQITLSSLIQAKE